MSTPRLVLSLASLTLTTLVAASQEPSLEGRLEKLEQALEAARVEAHVPGMSIAVVRDDELVWARGFGLADVAAGRAADEQTIYAVGSTTKAFTSTLIGMLVDEGRMSWDDPVTAHLPYFALEVQSDDAHAVCTLRDLLSHRHGFARMSILWFNSDLSREEVLRTAVGAEPWDDFRARFHYCNVAYVAAGEAAGVAGGSTWDALMADRLLEPLGMTSSTLSVSAAREDPRLALGYRWDEADEQCERAEMIVIDNVGPAGSVNSNVLDMAQWVRLQLGRGAVDDLRLISAERLAETWTPQIEMGPGVAYGLGWMLREHDGRRVVEHGGNIDGFSAQVTLVPEEDLGYVLLMNLDAAPLRERSLALVLDALLDEWPEERPLAAAEAPEVDRAQLVGTYIANFASFRDAEFQVLVDGEGRLALDIPGQSRSALEPPDADGHWRSNLSDEVVVSFQRDGAGDVVGLTVHQGPYTLEVPREGVEIRGEVPAEELEKYLGTYVRDRGGKRVELLLHQGRLTMEDRGRRIPFHTPDADGHAVLRVRADQGATFDVDADGYVGSFVFHGDAGDRRFARAPADAELPSVADVLALRDVDARLAALEAAGGVRASGRARFAQAGVEGQLTVYTQGGERYAKYMDFGRFGRIEAACDGERAWRYTSMRGLETLKGAPLRQALLERPAATEGDWRELFEQVEVVRNDTLNERPVHVVRLANPGEPARTYWIDAEHGDLLRTTTVVTERGMHLPVTVTFFDFEHAGGLRSPRRAELENDASGRLVLTFERVESGLALDAERFTLEGSDAE